MGKEGSSNTLPLQGGEKENSVHGYPVHGAHVVSGLLPQLGMGWGELPWPVLQLPVL